MVVIEGMTNRSAQFSGWFRWFLRLLFVPLFWTGGLYTLLLLSEPIVTDNESSALALPAQSAGPSSNLGPFRYTQWDPQNGNRLQFSISLDGMTVNPGTFGVFQTGLFKTVQVRSLQVRRYEYPSDPGMPGLGSDPAETALRALELDNPQWITALFGADQEPLRLEQGIQILVDHPDLSDAGQLLVENFDYRILCEGKPRLSMSSKRAFASWDQSGILLRGGAVVTAADGATVRSNRIRWNPRDRFFSVEDNYLLTAGPSQTAGKSVYLDEHLNIIDAAPAVSSTHTTEGTNYARR